MNKKERSKYITWLAKQSHKKSPRSKEFYQKMQKKSVASRLARKELSTKSIDLQ